MTYNALEIAFCVAAGCILGPRNYYVEEQISLLAKEALDSNYDSEKHAEIMADFSYSMIDLILNKGVSATALLNDILELKQDSEMFKAMEHEQQNYLKHYGESIDLSRQSNPRQQADQDDIAQKFEAAIYILDDLQPIDKIKYFDDFDDMKKLAQNVDTLGKLVNLNMFMTVNKPQAPQ